MKKVMVFGTFDLLHEGHIHFLKSAKKNGDYLMVIVARDKTVRALKGNDPVQNEKERLRNISKLDVVDKAVIGNEEPHKFGVIKALKPDIICLGYDQRSYTQGLDKKLKGMDLKIKIVRLKPYKPHKYKTSIIKKARLK
jgi:cytidyltransferase-like protein